MPQAGAGDQYSHADLFEMAAAYLFHTVRSHPFVDGNKQTGAAAALVFLEMNGIRIRAANEALVTAVLAVAEGKLQKGALAEFLRGHAQHGRRTAPCGTVTADGFIVSRRVLSRNSFVPVIKGRLEWVPGRTRICITMRS